MGYKPTLVLAIYFNINRSYFDFNNGLILNFMVSQPLLYRIIFDRRLNMTFFI